MTNESYIVEVASALLQRCDGAVHKDGVGYNKVDTHLVRYILNSPNPPSRRAIEFLRRLLLKYKRQITSLGYDYNILTKPVADIAEKQWLTIKHNLQLCDNNNVIIHRVGISGDWDSIMEEKDVWKLRNYRWNPYHKVWEKKYMIRSEEEREELRLTLYEYGVSFEQLNLIDKLNLTSPEVIFGVLPEGLVAVINGFKRDDFTIASNILKNYGFNFDGRRWVLNDYDYMLFDEITEILKSRGYKIIDETNKYFLKEKQKFEELRNKVKKKIPHLYHHQVKGVARALLAPGFGFFWDMGAGKTHAMLSLTKLLKLPTIIVAPVSIIPEWVKINNKFFNLTYQVIKGDKRRRIKQYQNLQQINLVSYETLRNDIKDITKIGLKGFILALDEATKVKNEKTKTYKAIKSLVCNATYVTALTGTPLENHLKEFYNIINIIKPGYMTWQEFASKYCVWGEVWTGYKTVKVIEGYKNLDRFRNRIRPISHRVRKEDVLPDLPPKIWQYRFVEMSTEQLKTQKMLVTEAKNQDKGFIGVYQLLRVLADGLEYLQDSSSPVIQQIKLPKPKINPKKIELAMLLEEIGQRQVVIFTSFERVALDLYSTFKAEGYSVQVITGATPHERRAEIINNFNEGKFQLLVCDDVLAYGVNLPQIDYLINYDIHPNPAKMKQRADRIHRIDSKRAKTIISLVSGIERDIYEILKEKNALFEQVVEGVEAEKIDITSYLAEKYGFK